MDLQDGGAEQDIMEGHPGGGEQETETETPDTHTEKESNSPSQSTKQAESRQGDITDGDHSETPQDKDGDNLCVKEKEENVKSNEDFPGSGGDGSDSPSCVTLTDTLDSPKHARDSDEEKDSEASKASQSREQSESLDPEGKAHSEAAGNKETVVVIDDLQTLPPEQSDPDQVDKSTQRKEKEEEGQENSRLKEEEEGDGNITEGDQIARKDDQIESKSSHINPDSPSSQDTAKDTSKVDPQLATEVDDSNIPLASADPLNPSGQDPEQQEQRGAQPGDGDPSSTSSALPAELDDFFAHSAGGKTYVPSVADSSDSKQQEQLDMEGTGSTQAGFFPALDNVDLETDEELLDGDKTEGQSERKSEPAEFMEEHREEQEGVANQQGSESLQHAKDSHDFNAGDRREQELATSPKSSFFCSNNYQLQPGIKECLILETGEQFICVNPPNEEHELGPEHPETEQSVCLVQSSKNVEGDDGIVRFDSPPLSSEEDTTPQVYRTVHPTMLRIDRVISPSEAFAYVSFDDGGSGDGRGSPHLKHSEGLSQRKFLNGMQQGYITSNGIPVIMDNAEEEVITNPSWDRLGHFNDIRDQTSPSSAHNVFSCKQGSRDRHSPDYQREFMSADVLSNNVKERYSEMEEDSGEEFYLWERMKKEAKEKEEEKRDESEELIELVPDDTDNSDGGGGDTLTPKESSAFEDAVANSLRLNLNNNNDGGDEDPGEERDRRDENNSANGRLSRGSRQGKTRSKAETSSKPVHRSLQEQASDYSTSHRLRPDSHTSYNRHSPSRSSYLQDSSPHRSHDSSSLYRSGKNSSMDSRLSTRYRYLDRGDAQTTASRTESSTVPRFNTLHDQQVSWLDMFKMIEAQHRTELRSQHEQHERLLQEMQHNMARELSKQQDTLKHSLTAHREILEGLSPGRHGDLRQNKNQSRKFDDVEGSSVDSQRSAESLADQSSHTTLQGVDVSLKNPPPFSRYRDLYDSKDASDIPVKRSLESELSSPSRPADTSLGHSRVSMGGDKQLRGGVYSSPMPLAKSKHKNSPRAHKSSSEGTVHSSPNNDKSRNANSARKVPSEVRRDHLESTDVSMAESEDFLSPRTRVNLREKHARHLADLRAYYEEELRDMRQMLQASQRNLERAGAESSSSKSQSQQEPPGKSMEEKILAKENEELRQRCREVQDDYHDAKSEIRELQQKIQGLEIRASDYAERYSQSQAQVLSLGTRLEELTEFAKEKESTSSDLEAKNKRVAESLQMAYKKEKEMTESLHSAKTTIQRLVDKYEMLEKDYALLKESAAANQEKLLQSRHEAIETNNKLSRLELDNKQLQHDNEILKHDLTMARSSLTVRTSYEDSFSPSRTRERGRANHSASTAARARLTQAREASPDDEVRTVDDDHMQSPILRAEQELLRLQGSVGPGTREFAPKLQRKFYGTEVPSHTGVSTSNRGRSSLSPNSKTRSPLEKKGRSVPLSRDAGKNTKVSTNRSTSSSKAEPSNYITERERFGKNANQKERKTRDSLADRDQNGSSRKSAFTSNGMSGELAMERIKSGDIVSRPDWEDLCTSMTPSRSGRSGVESTSVRAATREQILQERVQNIDNLEKKYDKLVTQKRKYESSLSKLPVHGHRGEKERLEAELDQLDKELGSVRMSLKRFHVLKSTI